MSEANPSPARNAGSVFWSLARIGVGIVFIYMGWAKAFHPEDFLKLLGQYHLTLAPVILNTIACTLPWFEIFCGILMVLGVAVPGTSLVLLAMLIPFTAVILHRGLAIHALKAIPLCAVKFDCGCGAGEEFVCRKLTYNAGLIILCCCFLAGAGRRWALRYRIV
jgi:uncharacterized membrane protein YphA (DoxX/SURF4 family)